MNNKYTMKEFKEMFDKAVIKTLKNPEGKRADKEDAKHLDENGKFSLMISGMLLFNTLEENLFKNE